MVVWVGRLGGRAKRACGEAASMAWIRGVISCVVMIIIVPSEYGGRNVCWNLGRIALVQKLLAKSIRSRPKLDH